MFILVVATLCAGVFAGAAIYINAVDFLLFVLRLSEHAGIEV